MILASPPSRKDLHLLVNLMTLLGDRFATFKHFSSSWCYFFKVFTSIHLKQIRTFKFPFFSKLSKEAVGIQESVIRISKKLISFAVLLIATSFLSNRGADVLNNCFVVSCSQAWRLLRWYQWVDSRLFILWSRFLLGYLRIMFCLFQFFLCFCKTFIDWHLYLRINTH